MDADYLQKNIAGALNEALTSMTIKHPDDEVEFLGRFLLKYGERKNVLEETKKSLADAESKLVEYLAQEESKAAAERDKAAAQTHAENTYENFLLSLAAINSSKADAMQEAVNFMESQMNIPAAYMAVKRVAGETETLNYVAASPSQAHIVGKKLVKVAVDPDAEDAPTRQGISFECLKIPEPPEEEEPPAEEEEDPDAPRAAKPPPVAQPLFVENTMRETRCKFFGIPKLGAFVAIPFSYASLDHEGGCVLNPGEGEAPEPRYELVRSKAEFVIGIDSIGKYRLFKPAEVEKIQAIGAELIKVFEKLEAAEGDKQLSFFADPKLKETSDAIPAVMGKLADEEAQAMTEVGAAMGNGGEGGEGGQEGAGEPAPGAELLRPAKETEAVCVAIGRLVSDGAVARQLGLLKGHVLPLPSAASNLFFACGCLLGEDPATFSECGSANWAAFRTGLLDGLTGKIAAFNPAAALTGLAAENTVASIKAYVEANGIADASTLPPNLPALGVLSAWLGKALAAREAAMAYQLAANQLQLECIADASV